MSTPLLHLRIKRNYYFSRLSHFRAYVQTLQQNFSNLDDLAIFQLEQKIINIEHLKTDFYRIQNCIEDEITVSSILEEEMAERINFEDQLLTPASTAQKIITDFRRNL